MEIFAIVLTWQPALTWANTALSFNPYALSCCLLPYLAALTCPNIVRRIHQFQ